MKIQATNYLVLVFITIMFSCKNDKTENKGEISKDKPITMKVFNDEDTKAAHFVKAQYYRWYQLYERPMNEKRIANQLDLLLEDFTLQSAAGVTKGHDDYTGKLDAYKGWKNAHHVQNVTFKKDSAGTHQLIADIRYQNIKPDGEKAAYAINYVVDFENVNKALKKIANIDLKATGVIEDEYVDAYPKNRMMSLMHYWIANVEQLDGNVTPFKEILTDDFSLNLSATTKLNSFEDLQSWINTAAQQLKQGSHHVEDLNVKSLGDNQYEVNIIFDWYGITKTDDNMTMKTQHKWLVIDNPDERFARIKSMDVSKLENLTNN
jgi:hypothetical protein